MKKMGYVFMFGFLYFFSLLNVSAFSNDELLKTIKNEDIYNLIIDDESLGGVAIQDDKLIFSYTPSNGSFTTIFNINDDNITLESGNTTTDGKIIDAYFVSSVIRSIALLNGNSKEEIDNFTSDNVSFNDYTYDKDGLLLVTITYTEEIINDNSTITITYDDIETFKIKKTFKIVNKIETNVDTRRVSATINNNILTITGDYTENDKCNIYLSEESEALFYPMYKTVSCKDSINLDELGNKTYYLKVGISTSNTWSNSVVYNYVSNSNSNINQPLTVEEQVKEGEVENPDTGIMLPIKEIILFLGLSLAIFIISRKKYLRRL
mgnify:FL=1